MKYWFVLFLIAITCGCSRKPVEIKIKVGDAAPDFSLQDQEGRTVSLDQLLSQKKYVAIVFYRSADW